MMKTATVPVHHNKYSIQLQNVLVQWQAVCRVTRLSYPRQIHRLFHTA